MNHQQVFSESQILEIVQRAVHLQEEAHSTTAPYTPGVTRSELERIATEVGVKPEFLEQAIRELSTPAQRKAMVRNPLFRQSFERVIDAELPMEKFDLVAEDLPMRGTQAPPTQIGRSLRVKTMTGTNVTDVTITARQGRTRVKVETFPLLSWIFGGQIAFVSTIIGSGMITDKGLVGAGVSLIAAGIATGIGFLLGTARYGSRRAEALAASVTRKVEEETASEAAPLGATTTSGVQDPTEVKVEGTS